MTHEHVLELLRCDPFAAGFDQVGDAIGELHEAVLVESRDIAGAKPTVLRPALGRRVARITAGDPRTAHEQLAAGAIVGGNITSVVADTHVDERWRHALLAAQAIA